MSKTKMSAFGTSNRVGHDSREFYDRKMYSESLPQQHIQKAQETECGDSIVNKIYNHSSADMYELPDNSIHLMVTSPPYNVGKEYDDDLSEDEYLDLLNTVWREVYRVLVPGGRACVNIANVGRKPYIPMNAMISKQMNDIGFLMRGEVIWNKSASAGTSCAWGSWRSASNPVLRDTHEYILIFSKGKYNRPAQGKQSTIAKDEFLEYTKSVWKFAAESAKRVKHPAPYPIELPRRLIQLYTYINDIILDPFMGSGTSAVASIKSDRRYVGYDTCAEYVDIANERITSQSE